MPTTHRPVHQPRERVRRGAPTFQQFVDQAGPLPVDYLRDEYLSSWGSQSLEMDRELEAREARA